jgi:hypothetical protein
LDGNSFSKSHWPLKDEEVIDWCKDFEAFIGQGKQAQGVMEAHQRKVVSFLCVGGVEGKVMEIREWSCV